MRIEQLHVPSLGHASYVVGSDETGEALVVDPQRDVRAYLETARAHGWRIRWVVDTHQHNDYLSGLVELAERTGARPLGSAYADLKYHHRGLTDGERFALGEVGIEVMHTPGHTPEHVSFLLYDGGHDAQVPAALLSGGALLVGDIARPDLLGGTDDTRDAAHAFLRTVRDRLLVLPDYVLVYPTHVAGSLCGGSIGSRMVTTVGYERNVNTVLRDVAAAEELTADLLQLDTLPAVPPYWPRMRAQNQAGVAPLGAVDPPPALSVMAFAAERDDGRLVLDARSPEAFAGGHIPGALTVGVGSSFPTWVGTVLPADATVLVVVDSEADLDAVTWGLLRTGYPRPVGWLAGGMQAWRSAALGVDTLPVVTPADVCEQLEKYHVLDVRQPDEWAAGHAPGAQHITGAELPARLDEVPDDRPVLVVCGSGYRSTVAAGLLRHHGNDCVINLSGGWAAWTAAGLPRAEP